MTETLLCAIRTLYTAYELHVGVAREALRVTKIMLQAYLEQRPPHKQPLPHYGVPNATNGPPREAKRAPESFNFPARCQYLRRAWRFLNWNPQALLQICRKRLAEVFKGVS